MFFPFTTTRQLWELAFRFSEGFFSSLVEVFVTAS